LHGVLDYKPALSRFSNALKINALSFISFTVGYYHLRSLMKRRIEQIAVTDTDRQLVVVNSAVRPSSASGQATLNYYAPASLQILRNMWIN